jgi:hypothetical protein
LTQEAEDLNSEEDRLGWPLSDFEALLGAKKMFVPFYKLWGVAYHYSKAQQRWRKGPVCQLNAEEVVSAALHTLVLFVGTIRWDHSLVPFVGITWSLDQTVVVQRAIAVGLLFLGGEVSNHSRLTLFFNAGKNHWRHVAGSVQIGETTGGPVTLGQ